jgi:hypothetical protein
VTEARQLVRLCRFLQRQNGGHNRLDHARIDEGGDLAQLRAVRLGLHPGSTHTSRRDRRSLDLSRMNTLSSHHRLPLFIDHRCPCDGHQYLKLIYLKFYVFVKALGVKFGIPWLLHNLGE